ncbi:MAG: hypothetical protein RML93_11665 [Anaerolineales bacterium]|nr:hypothetical protein [Anaerolineales bacterium]MDW8447932.1 hypothetical protein [Anaerolineales bacterium]
MAEDEGGWHACWQHVRPLRHGQGEAFSASKTTAIQARVAQTIDVRIIGAPFLRRQTL